MSNILVKLVSWFDAYAWDTGQELENPDKIDLLRLAPFFLMHVACLLVFVVGWSPAAVTVALVSYLIRMFAITGFYHRYFSHRAYKTSRIAQFIFGFIGTTAAQRGPLWWASHHRHHHQTSDTPDDPHSPVIHGFLHSHCIWFLTDENSRTLNKKLGDWRKFPELVWLDRFHIVGPVAYAFAMLFFGKWLAATFPSLGTTGWQVFVWGFVVSTVFVYHGTYTINSLSHLYGYRTFDTPDHSRNNPFLAIITLGEGWHNNHHHYAVSARQGFFPHEFDVTFYILALLEKLGIITNLRPVPAKILRGNSS
mgnify:CR=1 FL=1